MSVTIGKKSYKLTDVDNIGYGLKDTYIDYWDKEFNEDQRKEMWTGFGLTPSNYVYVQTWREREKKLAQELLAARSIQNQEYTTTMERNKAKLDALEEYSKKDSGDPTKMGDKGVNAITAEMAIHNNKALHDINMNLAIMMERQAIEMYQRNTPNDSPPVSDDFNKVYFRRPK
jgi:hypothetical protein